MDYQQFLETKKQNVINSGFEVNDKDLNSNLFDFQKHIVKKALKAGRYAIFADCGLGKTLMQLEWANQVVKKTGMPVLILAPLAVSGQTIKEGDKFGIKVWKWMGTNQLRPNTDEHYYPRIYITNYEQLKNIDQIECFAGVVLDESSILKGRDGKLSRLIIDSFVSTQYKLACTATPSPNDHMELGQHSEFIGAMSYLEMLAMFFVHDGGETSKWRLRKHATDDFWKYVCTWSISLDNPKTLGYQMDGYDLPEIEYIEHIIKVENNTGTLFSEAAVSATDLNKDLRRSLELRVNKTYEIIGNSDEQFIIWGLQNAETDLLNKKIHDAVNVQGSDKPELKAKNLIGFADEEFQNLVTKTSIASFGMNYQQCHNMIFCSYDFKFEAFYQAVRRCYRFGQKQKVKVHIIIPESQMNVRKSILEKEQKHKDMIHNMSLYSAQEDFKLNKNAMVNTHEITTEKYKLLNGDCVEKSKFLKDNEADLIIFSPPFAELYVYSDKPEDMGNVSNYKEFEQHFKYLIPELKRVLKPGRIAAVHCMDLPIQKG